MAAAWRAIVGLLVGGAASAAEVGYSLDDAWGAAWRRIADRSGRPDPEGGLLQRFAGRQYPEYQLNLWVAEPPLELERAWAARGSGARLWVQSLDEFELANRFQLKARASILSGGWLGVRFDRVDGRETESDLVRLDFGLSRGELFGALSFYPRWEKDDSDVEAAAGWRREGWGEVRLRLFAFDPFTNASFGLAELRGAVLLEHADQLDLPLGIALEASSAEIRGVRGELYLGRLWPARTQLRYPAEPGRDHVRQVSGLLGGALVEWQPFALPLRVGASGLGVHARSHWDGASDRSLDETTWRAMLYALAELPRKVSLEAFLALTARPETGRATDEEWLWSLRARWMPTGVVGADLAFLRLSRRGPAPVAGANHRVVTRMVLALGEKVWSTFGVGWDLDPGDGPYDGGGATILVEF